jgi:predicted DNA-binding protein (MmcQ/YjbR family)
MKANDFRRIALGLSGTIEKEHMGHPDFRANGRIFASLLNDERDAMVKLEPEEQKVYLRAHKPVFQPASGAWGRQGCTIVTLARADKAAVHSALKLAYAAVMAKAPPRKRRAAVKR